MAACWPKAPRKRSCGMRAWSRPISAAARPVACAPRCNPMAEALLDVSGVCAGYDATQVLRDVSLTVAPGEIVAVLGSNGAGKSTLNRTISGVLRATRGNIRFAGAAIERERPAAIVARGLIHVPEGRHVFSDLTVAENLDLGGYRRAGARRDQNRQRVFTVFP